MIENSTTEDKAKKQLAHDQVPKFEWPSDASLKWQRAQAPSEFVTHAIPLIWQLFYINEKNIERELLWLFQIVGRIEFTARD